MDMKLRGMYIARQLSFHGVSFKIEEVPLSTDFEKAYDDSVLLVSFHLFHAFSAYFVKSSKRSAKLTRTPYFSSGLKQCKSSPKQPS